MRHSAVDTSTMSTFISVCCVTHCPRYGGAPVGAASVGAMFSELRVPIVVAPMAGGPSTPELVAGAVNAGAFGFLAGGNLTADALTEQISRTEGMTEEPFGVNLFVPGEESTADISDYA